MMQITINDSVYDFTNKIEDLDLFQWVELQQILSEKEMIKVDEYNDGTFHFIEALEESETFIFNKHLKILMLLSNIPETVFREVSEDLVELLLKEIVPYKSNDSALNQSKFFKQVIVSIRDKDSLEVIVEGFKVYQKC
jgi:hypothetical protein